ncbi:EndoU domain-containing protein [Rathayibacter toxicus]|uniref:Bacterial EndoU nuclease domain-containing protein n=2 Tax=Rathayibacter toxicus TaxID=145458 RepID=A0A0U1PQQ4_9MICO|nr:EndoU domain-containing protein [Rathayibacter toxicus]KKM44258.1 hypothetical protein VT73_10110 [Rathayibacter toxicus]PPH66569.1 hypothetical protein C5D01_07035 [Rathayibacter toxicus]PPH80792.1 hypothetical protein C5D20_07020 [Rathayibacter toxicus]PPH90861.1 hypothetical protein C5D37_07025 [Rathayibacter toxicus]PPI48412.1 hypothetical protein C5C66_07010 [Rathayibacter toxicus]
MTVSTETTGTAATLLDGVGPALLTTPKEHTNHILEGELMADDYSSYGKPGKITFPRGWSKEKVRHYILDIANDPRLTWKPHYENVVGNFTKSGTSVRFTVFGVREGITIKVVIEPFGEGILTAYPSSEEPKKTPKNVRGSDYYDIKYLQLISDLEGLLSPDTIAEATDFVVYDEHIICLELIVHNLEEIDLPIPADVLDRLRKYSAGIGMGKDFCKNLRSE